jgi:hypothetical protein
MEMVTRIKIVVVEIRITQAPDLTLRTIKQLQYNTVQVPVSHQGLRSVLDWALEYQLC